MLPATEENHSSTVTPHSIVVLTAIHNEHLEFTIGAMGIKFIKNIGFLLLAIWLILTGLATFISALGALGPILAILAIVAGVFIIIGR